MMKVKQNFISAPLADIEAAVRQEFARMAEQGLVRSGQKTAVCLGSRGIANLDRIAAAAIQCLLQLGAQPYIVPAMGSHGNACASGQLEVLASYGITEATMGVPIRAGTDTLLLGHTEHDVPVYADVEAAAADLIIPINRVKAHTDFKAPIESGLLKMLAVGLGNKRGASALHEYGSAENFHWLIPEVGRLVAEKLPVSFGLTIVEDGYDQTSLVKAIPCPLLEQEETELLALAKSMMPGIRIPSFDILIVEEFGKDISGSGMDPNITGRCPTGAAGFHGPDYQCCVVLSLTPASHGNAIALSAADIITRRVFEQIDFAATYQNCLACHSSRSAQIPMIAEDEQQALSMATQLCRGLSGAPRIVRIKNTLAIDELWISENLADVARSTPGLEIVV